MFGRNQGYFDIDYMKAVLLCSFCRLGGFFVFPGISENDGALNPKPLKTKNPDGISKCPWVASLSIEHLHSKTTFIAWVAVKDLKFTIMGIGYRVYGFPQYSNLI